MASRHGKNVLQLLSSIGMSLACAVAHAGAISHEDAVRLALERAPIVQARKLDIVSAQAQSETSGRLPDPSLIVGLDNVPIEGGGAYSLTSDFMTMRKIGVMQDVPNGQKRSAQRAKAEAQIALSRTTEEQAELDVARSASQAWIALQSAMRLQSAMEDMSRRAEAQARTVRAALSAGRGSTADALSAQSAAAEFKDRLLTVRSQVETARAELERWIGESVDAAVEQGPDYFRLPAPREQLLSSLHRHAQLRALEQQIEVARTDVALALADKHPDWSVAVTYAKRADAFGDMVSMELRMGLPLFSAHRQDPAIRATKATVSQLEAMRESQLQMHTAETAAQLAAWDAARARYELLRTERMPLARQRVAAARSAYQSGAGAIADVLAASVAESQLLTEQAQIENQLGQAWSFLRYLESEVSP
jgi:outer membrane protein TolC